MKTFARSRSIIFGKNTANLFKGSHGYSDGEQQRDFIYVDDVCNVNLWFLANSHISGIYNLGTGKPTSFNEVAKAIRALYSPNANINNFIFSFSDIA